MIRLQFKILLAWKQEVNTDQCVNGMPGLTLQFKNRFLEFGDTEQEIHT